MRYPFRFGAVKLRARNRCLQSLNRGASSCRTMRPGFAQFEREVTAERIRDKIAASKRKGMWMGGLPPLGYDVRDKKLVVNVDEAKIVHQLFALYMEHKSVRRLKAEADRLGLRTKRRIYEDKVTGGQPFSELPRAA